MKVDSVNWIGLWTAVRREIERTFRVAIQTLVAPVISAALYIFIFGFVIGNRIEEIAGVSYITFVFPGILLLNVIASSFGSASSSLYFMRFTRGIEEILIAPFSYLEMVIGFIFGAVIRSFMVAILIMGVGLVFGAVALVDPLGFIFYVVVVSIIFALLGLLVGLWAEGFEQLQVLNTFVITPLTYLGGIFYSITMLPELAATLTYFNPFFYFVNGLRGSMVGLSEVSAAQSAGLSLFLVLILGTLVVTLFRRGWRLRS